MIVGIDYWRWVQVSRSGGLECMNGVSNQSGELVARCRTAHQGVRSARLPVCKGTEGVPMDQHKELSDPTIATAYWS